MLAFYSPCAAVWKKQTHHYHNDLLPANTCPSISAGFKTFKTFKQPFSYPTCYFFGFWLWVFFPFCFSMQPVFYINMQSLYIYKYMFWSQKSGVWQRECFRVCNQTTETLCHWFSRAKGLIIKRVNNWVFVQRRSDSAAHWFCTECHLPPLASLSVVFCCSNSSK